MLSDTLVEARRGNKGPDRLGYFASERYQSKKAEKQRAQEEHTAALTALTAESEALEAHKNVLNAAYKES